MNPLNTLSDTGESIFEPSTEPSTEPSSEPSDEDTAFVDADEDGVPEELDCDDSDPSIGLMKMISDCDGVLTDQDCDDTDSEWARFRKMQIVMVY